MGLNRREIIEVQNKKRKNEKRKYKNEEKNEKKMEKEKWGINEMQLEIE